MRRFTVLTLLVGLFTIGATAQKKKRVAVMNFDYATVQSGISSIFGSNVDVGKGIADMLVMKLVEGGTYSVIERKAIDKIMAEQNFSNSDRADPTSAAKIGKLLGVDAMIVGSITQFGRDDKNTKVGAGGLGGFGSKYGIGGIGKKEAKAAVVVTARIVDINTGEILVSANGKGESTRSGTSLLGAGGGGGSAGGANYDMSSSNFSNTIIGEATSQAVNQLSTELQAGAGKLPTVTVSIDGLVADATGGTLVLNIGSKAGIKKGDRFSVKRSVREIKDPASGRVIRTIEDSVGEVVITDVDAESSVGTFTGSQPAKVGDHVRN